MYKLLLLSLITTPAIAGTTLSGEHVAVGVNVDGSLCDTSTKVCISYDPDGMGSGVPLGNDLIWPGRAFENWGLEFTNADGPQSIRGGAPDYSGGPELRWDEPVRGPEFMFLSGQHETADFDLQLMIDLPIAEEQFWTTFILTAKTPLTDVSFARSVDVDPDVFSGGGYSTAAEADGEIASAASRKLPGKAIALAISGGDAGMCSWCALPSDIRDGQEGNREGDIVIGVATEPVDLAAGETVEARFVYALGTDAEDARSLAAELMGINDLDGDGQTPEEGDCDDRDSTTFDGAAERVDGVDNDCDGDVDEDTIASDDDGDGWTEEQGDCDDSSASVFPGAPPSADVIDADCDGLADDDPFITEQKPEGWGGDPVAGACASAPAASPFILLLLPLLLARRRT